MCSATESNRWAPRLVIVLQLATWSVVGIVLLQRGASSLRGTSVARKSAAQIQVPQVSLSDRQDIQDNLDCQQKEAKWALEDSSAVQRSNPESDSLQDRSRPKEDSINLTNVQNDESPSSVQSATESCITRTRGDSENRISNGNLRKRMRAARARERIAQGQLLPTDEKKKILEDNSLKDYFLSVTSAELDISIESNKASSKEQHNTSLSEQTTPRDTNAGIASSSRGEAPRLKPVDRAGAAAAVAMLAIGVVMLLLAPAIVILRAVEARRQERRRPKLMARKDLPPTYEEATLMDEAPRYSSLQLNNINESETALTVCTTTS